MNKRMTLIEKLEKELAKNCRLNNLDLGFKAAIDIVKWYSEWIGISVEPSNRTEFDSEAVLAIDVNGYAYNVTLAGVGIAMKD